jgi:hypothetical protein
MQISRNVGKGLANTAQAQRRSAISYRPRKWAQRVRQMRGKPNNDKKAEFRAQPWLRPELQLVRSDRECERLTACNTPANAGRERCLKPNGLVASMFGDRTNDAIVTLDAWAVPDDQHAF